MKISLSGHEMPVKALKRKTHRMTDMIFSTVDEKKIVKTGE